MSATTYDLGDVRVTVAHHRMFGMPVINEVQERKGVEKHRWYVDSSLVAGPSEKLRKMVCRCEAPNKKEMQRKTYELYKALRQ